MRVSAVIAKVARALLLPVELLSREDKQALIAELRPSMIPVQQVELPIEDEHPWHRLPDQVFIAPEAPADVARAFFMRKGVIAFLHLEMACTTLHANWDEAWTWCPQCGCPRGEDGVPIHVIDGHFAH